MNYARVTCGLNDPGKLVPYNEILSYVKDINKDYYRSIYLYNDEQYKFFKQNNTIAGITDVIGHSVVFDFDSKHNPDEAQSDTIELCTRLISCGLNQDDFIISFSGNKGFSVEIETEHSFTPEELKNLCFELAKNLSTFDKKMYNASRVFRIRNTKHNITGLFKTPITLKDLTELTIDQIKSLAQNITEYKPECFIVTLSQQLLELSKSIESNNTKQSINGSDELPPLDLSMKPKNFPGCKWAILHGHFKPGNRNSSLMALAAHYKAQGTPKEVTYRILKGSCELQSRRFNQEPYSKEEIWNNIISVVYGPNWQGKTYACKDHAFLQDSCPVGIKGTSRCGVHKKESLVQIGDMMESFSDFAVNIEKNLIKTGLKEVDEQLMLSTSMSVGLLGSPGSGKTSLALEILANAKNDGATGLFCSLDMGSPIVAAKMISNVANLDAKTIIGIFKNNPKKRSELMALAKAKYGHFPVTFKNGQSVEDIKELVVQQQDKTGQKIKLIVIDYLECLLGPYSDATANSAFFAGQLKDLSTELETCVITLVQPQKSAGDPSYPLLSMRKIKGASTLEQNFRAVLSVYREGFNPANPGDDKFMTVACLKNTLGSLFSVDYRWHGLRGELSPMTAEDHDALAQIRERISSEKDNSDGGW